MISTDVAGDSVGSQLVVALDSTGTATAAWTRSNPSNQILQFATKPLSSATWPAAPSGNTTTPGANDLSPLGGDAGQPAIAIGPDGTTTIAWTEGGVNFERTRGAGASAFAGSTTLPTTLTGPNTPLLAAGPSGMVALWLGMSSGAPAIGAASRAAGATTFTALPNLPGTGNSAVVAGIDDQGNVPAAWINNNAAQNTVQATGLDVAPPVISNVSFPSTAVAGTLFPYSATALDRWSATTATWAFGDGSTGPLSGNHTYTAAGSFVATLTATDAFGNSAHVSQNVQVSALTPVPPPPTPPAPKPTAPPTITGLKLSPSTFKAASSGPTIATATGTTIRYAVSQQSTTTFTVQLPATGVRKGRSCVAPPKHKGKQKLKRCQRFINRGSFRHTDAAAGVVSFRFTGRINGRKLSPAKYQLQAIGANTKGKGAAKVASFRIVKR
jgi:hypothetical protein